MTWQQLLNFVTHPELFGTLVKSPFRFYLFFKQGEGHY